MRKLLYILLLIGSFNNLYGQYSCETAIEFNFCGGGYADPLFPECENLVFLTTGSFYSTFFQEHPAIEPSFDISCTDLDSLTNQIWYYFKAKSEDGSVSFYNRADILLDSCETGYNEVSNFTGLCWGPFSELPCEDSLVVDKIIDCNTDVFGNSLTNASSGELNFSFDLDSPDINTEIGDYFVFLLTIRVYVPNSYTWTYNNTHPTFVPGNYELYCQPCTPNAGSLSSYLDVSSCQNEQDLNLLIEPEYNSTSDIPDPDIHGYTYVISDTDSGVLLSYNPSPNLSTFNAGNYTVCGLSYGLSSAGDFPSIDGVYTLNDLQGALAQNPQLFCGDLTEDCIEVIINVSYTNLVIDTTICVGENYLFDGILLTESGTYDDIGQTTLGCDSIMTLNLEVLPLAEETIAASYCLGESIVHNGVTYTSTALDSFDLTSASGCDSLLIVDVEFIDIQAVIEDLPTGICSQSNLQLNGSQSSSGSSVTYQWYNDMMPIMTAMSATLDVTANGLYILVVNNGTNCTARDSIIVDNIGLDYSITADVYQIIDCDSLELTLPVNINVGTDEISIVWTTTNGQIVGDNTVEDIMVDQAGLYTIDVENLTLNCSMTKTFEVFEDFEVPVTDLMVTQIGCDSPAQLIGSSNDPTDIPYWMGPDLAIPDDWSIETEVPGLYTFIVMGTNGCKTSIDVQVVANQDIPVFTFVQETALDCIDEEAKIIVELDHEGNFSYEYNSNGVPFTLSPNNLEVILLDAAELTLTITDIDNDCDYTASITIEDNQTEITADIGITNALCNGDANGAALLTNIQGGGAPYLFRLSTMDTWQSLPLISNLSAGLHTIELQDIHGCIESFDFEITEPMANTIEIVANTDIIELADSTILEVMTSSPLGIDTIIWSGGPVLSYISPEVITVGPLMSTLYTATLIDINGCSVQSTFTLGVNTNREVFIPTLFSPNFDGINDVLLIQSSQQVKEIRYLHIMDRWGGRVYSETHFPPNDPAYAWDGRVDNQDLQMGVYMYVMEVEFIDGFVEVFKGDVTLMR